MAGGAEVISWGICLLSSRGGCGVGTGGHSPAGSALAPGCPTWNRALWPSNGHPLWGGYSHLGAQSPGSFPMLARPVQLPMHSADRCEQFNFPSAPGSLICPLAPTTWWGIHHSPPDIRACTPLLCAGPGAMPATHVSSVPSVSGPVPLGKGDRPSETQLPNLSLLGLWPQHEGCWVPGPHPGERPELGTPAGWASVIHRPLTAPPPQL